jgi:deoxyribodipyrimidine photo-lyase
MVHAERVSFLRRGSPATGDCVLYWMQAAQRAEYNHALEYALGLANELRLPLLVFFAITERYPGANQRHYLFMLEGLREVQSSLSERGIGFFAVRKPPHKAAVELSGRASLLVTDCGYLRGQRAWRAYVARHAECPVIQVECEVIVPVRVASHKEEYSAATFRPRINKHVERFLSPLQEGEPEVRPVQPDVESVDLCDPMRAIGSLRLKRTPLAVSGAVGGTSEAKARLRSFLDRRLYRYHELGNDPSQDHRSGLSPYLHFGQISPVYVAMEVKKAGGPGADSFLEQLVVRRELSANLTHYNARYDSLDALPSWAMSTLREHAEDKRQYVYTLKEFESALTHDPCWNAAQKEMVATGSMHNYMRMYWGKKIVEWTPSHEEALRIALYLNDKYELDGRDPNGYAGVLWCFGKHDRAWRERPVLGKLRYMSEDGLRRKFDIEGYIRRSDAAYRAYDP